MLLQCIKESGLDTLAKCACACTSLNVMPESLSVEMLEDRRAVRKTHALVYVHL